MTMNKIMGQLRRHNKNQYTLLGICVFLSVLLVTSFTLMYFSPTVQGLLPEGGDTRKLSWLMMGVTFVGCTVFTVYGANLFFRHKSREIGVLLALGERKRKLGKCLAVEVGIVTARYALGGLVLSVPLSFLIWKGFEALILTQAGMKYRVGPGGLVIGIVFALFLVLCIFLLGLRFIRRVNLIDILNEQRKTEMVREIKPWTGRAGILLILTGLVLAMAVPAVCMRWFLFVMPSFWNVTYCISAAGLYLFMLSAIGRTGKGRNPEKYYKNIVSANLMRFTARQTTKNMCVITLLVFVLLLSAFWGAMYYRSAYAEGEDAPYDYSMHYPAEEKQITRDDIFGLAKKYNVDIETYEEAEAVVLYVDYRMRDLTDSGKYVDLNSGKLASFVRASDFSRIAGRGTELKPGEYKTIVPSGYHPSIWVKPDCLLSVENRELSYQGTEEFDNLTNTSEPFTFILSDEDYRSFAEAGKTDREKLVFFRVKDVYSTYEFAGELKKEYIAHAGALSDHLALYDAYEEKCAEQEGQEYFYSGESGLSVDNPELMSDWKYAPFFKVLIKADAMQMVAVFVLLSVYIAVISLAAVGVMTYVRSVTIAMDNRQLFSDLGRLGADRNYIERVIRRQLRKIFTYPTAAGSTIVLVFSMLLIYFNDMHLDAAEVQLFVMELGLIFGVALFMYVMYRVSLRRMERIVL